MSSLRPASGLRGVHRGPPRRGRARTATLALAGLLLAGTLSPGAALAAPPKPPQPLPTASSWVGGKQLISTRVLADLPAGVRPPPAPKAASWLVADLDSREILAGRRVHVPLAPASTLKILTALALAPELDPKAVYTGQDADAAIDGTKVGIDPGSTYTVDDLLHGLIMGSGNDCANALAELVGGRSVATGLMQDVATRLGAFDTVARNTSGLDAKGQVSSAYDLALAGSAALQDEQLAKIMKTTAYRFPGKGKSLGAKRSRFETQNHNRLLRNYDGSLGVKNGYTVAARGSFVGAAERGGRTYLAVVMRAEGVTWHQAADLLDWAFENGGRARPVGTLVEPGELPAKIGPAEGDDGAVLGVATGTPSPVPTPEATVSLRGALPGAAQTGLTPPAADSGRGRLWLLAAALALIGLSWAAGRRLRPAGRRSGGEGRSRGSGHRGGSGRPGGSGRSGDWGRPGGWGRRGGSGGSRSSGPPALRSRSGPRVRIPGAGRHRS